MEEVIDNKKKKIITIISAITIFAMVTSISFAYFSSKSTSNTQTVKAGNLSINYQENSSQTIMLSKITPIYDNEIETRANRVAFSITNDGTMKSYIDISIEEITMSDELSNLEFKWALYETDATYTSMGTKVSNGNFRNVDNNKQLLYTNILIEKGTTKYYKFYIWISEAGKKQDELQNKSFSGKIVIKGNQEEGQKLLSTVIKNNNSPIVTTTPDFTNPTTYEELIQGIDEDGETYYFRGAVEDNYVKINGLKWTSDAKVYTNGVNGTTGIMLTNKTLEAAEKECNQYYEDYGYSSTEECILDIQESGHLSGEDMLFRIVRINGDGTIRLITDGDVGESKFNENTYEEKYVGYTYDNSEPNKQDGASSTIKTYLDNWYNTNMTSYDKYIANTRFCNDTTVASTSGSKINYGSYNRVYTNKKPSFECENTDKTYGGEYDIKIGLITADEVQYAGGMVEDYSNYFYMAHKSYGFLVASPSYFFGNARVWNMGSYGNIISNTVAYKTGVRPTVNLRADTLYTTGNGTKDNPYVIK